MANKKDLVEAYAFSRRRLVTAFISGAPGGREVEPARPGRTVVGGLALAVLLIAGAAIAGIFAPRAPGDWTEPGLIVSKEDGNPYVITEDEGADEGDPPVLRPVINITSAKLILGSAAEPRIVPQEEIDKEIVGDDIGILGAPATVPSPSLLIPSGWTACTNAGEGVRVTITTSPSVRGVPGGAFLVSNGGESDDGAYYVIAVSDEEADLAPRAHSFRLPDDADARDNILGDLGLGSSVDNAIEVPDEWLALFPPGGPLEPSSFNLERVGDPPRERGADTGIPDDAVVGDVLVYDSRYHLVTYEGPAELKEFAAAVYLNQPDAAEPEDATGPLEERAESPYAGNHWPEEAPSRIREQPCALLQAEEGKAPTVLPGRLAEDEPDVTASSLDVAVDDKSQGVQAGHGAYVLSASFGDVDTGLPFLIDAKGFAYPLVGTGAAGQLGYETAEHPTVPNKWVELFDEGVPLSRDAALCPPDRQPGVTC